MYLLLEFSVLKILLLSVLVLFISHAFLFSLCMKSQKQCSVLIEFPIYISTSHKFSGLQSFF